MPDGSVTMPHGLHNQTKPGCEWNVVKLFFHKRTPPLLSSAWRTVSQCPNNLFPAPSLWIPFKEARHLETKVTWLELRRDHGREHRRGGHVWSCAVKSLKMTALATLFVGRLVTTSTQIEWRSLPQGYVRTLQVPWILWAQETAGDALLILPTWPKINRWEFTVRDEQYVLECIFLLLSSVIPV